MPAYWMVWSRSLNAGGPGAALVRRDPIDGLVESDMRVLPVEDAYKTESRSNAGLRPFASANGGRSKSRLS
jgi:hypothetical protein